MYKRLQRFLLKNFASRISRCFTSHIVLKHFCLLHRVHQGWLYIHLSRWHRTNCISQISGLMLCSHWHSLSTLTLYQNTRGRARWLSCLSDVMVSGVALRALAVLLVRRRAKPSPSTVVHLLKTSEWRKERCKEWRAWMSIWASSCPSISSSTGNLPAALTLRVPVWTQHNCS